jgi:D-glucuronyl C5-epimerase-like protein
MSLHRAGFCAAAAILVALACPGPALAARVLVLDGEHVESRDDPFVPTGVEGDLGRPPGGAPLAHATRRSAGRKALGRALRRARRAHRIGPRSYRRYVRIYRSALRVLRRLHGSRRRQLAYVVGIAERLAVRGRLVSSRFPAVFLLVRRNTQFWRSRAFPAANAKVRFGGSEILFQYYPGRGIQLQPLVNFKKANLMHGACVGAQPGPCRRAGLAHLLDELDALAARRSRRFIAWEYYFHFGGGSPPWMSGMAQATAMQALARAARLLGRPDLLSFARRALPAFQSRPPTGVRTRGFDGGPHYLQYSFASRTYIFNAFVQALIGLFDYRELTGDDRARELFDAAEPELRAELPRSDIGDWTLYSYRGPESDSDYHELLREVTLSLCHRIHVQLYCDKAARFRRYQTDPAVLRIDGPASAVRNQPTNVRFWVSKKSAVEVTVTREGAVGLHDIATFRRGDGSFRWRPRSTGTYEIHLAAKELRTGRGLRTREQSDVPVAPG